MRVKVKLLRDGAKVPTKATSGSAGFDLYAAEDCVVPAVFHRVVACEWCGPDAQPIVHVPGRLPVKTGIAIELEAGWEAQVRPRSGLAMKQGIGFTNAVGTVDSDYRGEILVLVINFDGKPFEVRKGDRIGQLVVKEVPAISMHQVEALDETRRGQGGFGSTGA